MTLSPISYVAGTITTAYGAYSYCTAKRKQQKETAKKVIAVGLGLIAVGAAIQYFGKTTYTGPEYLSPYVKALEGRVLPKTGAPLTHFPPYLSKFPHPGFLATKEGGMCKIDDIDYLPPLDECQQTFTQLVKQIKIAMPDVYAEGISHSSRWGKGYGIVVDSHGYKQFNFGMDQIIVDNYGKGLKEAERLFLQNPEFANQSENTIVESIKLIHKALAEKVKHSTPAGVIHPGVFREGGIVINDDKMEMTLEGMIKGLKEKGGTELDIANLKSWIQKGQQYGSFEAAKPFITAEETAVMKKIFHIPIDFKKIPSAMLALAKKLKEIHSLVKNKIVHPIAPAAWVHQECGNIHAFEDINGRVCRTLSNIVFQWGGLKGIMIPQDEPYTAAITADQKAAGPFADYLVNIINWNAKQSAFKS